MMLALIIYAVLGASMFVATVGDVLKKTDARNIKQIVSRVGLLLLASAFWPVTVIVALMKKNGKSMD